MRLPELTEMATAKDNTEEFKGYNHNLRNEVGEWYDQKNMSTDYYPAASPRDKRAKQEEQREIPVRKMFSPSYYPEAHANVRITNGSVEKDIYGLVCVNDSLIALRKFVKNLSGGLYTDGSSMENMTINNCWLTKYNKALPFDKDYGVGVRYRVEGVPVQIAVDSETECTVTVNMQDTGGFYYKKDDQVEFALFDSYSENPQSRYVSYATVKETTYAGYYSAPNLYVMNLPLDFSSSNALNSFVNAFNNLIGNDKGIVIVDVPNFEITNSMYVKAQWLSADNGYRSLVKMGSYVFIAPDGVVYESANSEVDVPVYRVAHKATLGSAHFETVIEKNTEESGYAGIGSYFVENWGDVSDGDFRVTDGAVQQYIEKSGMWVTVPTYVRITGDFDGLNEGDTVLMKYNTDGVPGDTLEGFFGGIISHDAVKGEFVEKSLKILKKGTSDGTDFIIVSGYVQYVWGGHHSEAFYTNNEGSFAFTRKMPEIKFACESQNRIWACSKDGHEIYASALGNPYNFYDYSGLATDSYAVNVGSEGEFTGCVNYMGQPLFFKENTLHYISGSYPSNNGYMDGMSYAVTTVTDFKGVEKGSEKSFAIIDNILYYKSAAGIVAYDGANTVVISDALGKEKYKNAVAGAYNSKYYVSMQDKNGVYHLFVYDTELGTWCKEDETQVLQFIKVNNELLYADASDNAIHSVSCENVLNLSFYETEDDFEWECETGNFGYSYPNNKYLSRFQVRMQIADGAKASIYIQYNSDGVWHRKGEMTGKGVRTHLIPIVPIRCDHMKIKFAGKGDVKIFSIAKIFEEGGDV